MLKFFVSGFTVLLLALGCSCATVSRDKIATTAEAVTPLPVGATVPRLVLQTAETKDFDLQAALRAKPAVVIFYRGGWCPYCNVHLGELQTVEPELVSLGYQILAVSPDRPEKLSQSTDKNGLSYTLLSDAGMKAARAFGIAFKVDAATVEKYKGYGIDLEEASGKKHHLLPVPAVFIVDRNGRVRFAYANADYKVRLEPEAVLKAAAAAAAK